MTTGKHMRYQEIQKQYLRKRQDEIWKTVRQLTSRSKPRPEDNPRTDSTTQPPRQFARSGHEGGR